MAKHQPQQGSWKHTLYGTNDGEWLVGYSSDDTIYANGGDDRADGVHGSDIIDGGDGNDTLEGGSGTDWLTGGSGADAFVMGSNDGWDIIYDFHRDQGDHVWVRPGGGNDYNVVVQDGDSYVDFGNGNGVVLVGVTDVVSSDIIFL